MEYVQIPRAEWEELKETVYDIYSLLKKKPVQKEWVRMKEFLELSGKTRNEAYGLFRIHPELKRKNKGEGVQINYKQYKDLFTK